MFTFAAAVVAAALVAVPAAAPLAAASVPSFGAAAQMAGDLESPNPDIPHGFEHTATFAGEQEPLEPGPSAPPGFEGTATYEGEREP
jgi:hypothetical protein